MQSKIVVIHQPDFLPYLGFFHRLMLADCYVALDTVQRSSSSRTWTNRDKIKTKHGEKWITIGVQKSPLETPINEVLLNHSDWRNDNLNLIRENYRTADYYDEIFPYIEKFYSFECDLLWEFTMRSILLLVDLFGIEVEIVYAHDLNPVGRKSELLVDILKKVNATTYLSGVGARDYHRQEPFDEAGIEVIWQDFKHPVYPQQFGEFIPYLSSIDLLFNCGVAGAREILKGTVCGRLSGV